MSDVLASLSAPAAMKGTGGSDALEAQDVALYVNGKRINAERMISHDDDGIGLKITFSTTIGSIESPGAESPQRERAWGGWKPGDTTHVWQPLPASMGTMPNNGFVQIDDIEPPAKAGDPAFFVCHAMTPIVDWRKEGEQICEGGDRVKIPATWFRR